MLVTIFPILVDVGPGHNATTIITIAVGWITFWPKILIHSHDGLLKYLDTIWIIVQLWQNYNLVLSMCITIILAVNDHCLLLITNDLSEMIFDFNI